MVGLATVAFTVLLCLSAESLGLKPPVTYVKPCRSSGGIACPKCAGQRQLKFVFLALL